MADSVWFSSKPHERGREYIQLGLVTQKKVVYDREMNQYEYWIDESGPNEEPSWRLTDEENSLHIALMWLTGGDV